MFPVYFILRFHLFIALLLLNLLMTTVRFRVFLAMLHRPCLGSGVQPVPLFGSQTSKGWYCRGHHKVLVGAVQPEPAVRAPRIRDMEAWGSCLLITLSHFNLLSPSSAFPMAPSGLSPALRSLQRGW